MIWIVGEQKVSGGFEVLRAPLNESVDWESMNISAVRITSLDSFSVIVVNEWGEIYSLRA